MEAGKTQTCDVFSSFLQKVALYQLCEGARSPSSFMVLWVGLRSPLAGPRQGHVAWIMFLEGTAWPSS